MFGKRERDYRRVLRTLKQLAPTLNPAAVVMDFEAAMWRAATAVFTQTRLFRFNFHWTQAVWRKVQELGLQASYRDNDATQRFCRKVMALPFLPSDHMSPSLDALLASVTDTRLQALCQYVNSSRLQSCIWNVTAVSVFNSHITTNNDLEGI